MIENVTVNYFFVIFFGNVFKGTNTVANFELNSSNYFLAVIPVNKIGPTVTYNGHRVVCHLRYIN